MDFKFRSGENQPSYLSSSSADGYFTAQALRAGYISSDFRRPEFLSHPIYPAREALRRELEKERIREEIIAQEIMRRRELEEEVRRELALEREIELRRHVDRFALASSVAGHSEKRILGAPSLHHERLLGTSKHDVGIVEKLLPVERVPVEKVAVERVPAEREAKPSIPEVGKGQVVFLGKSSAPVKPNSVAAKPNPVGAKPNLGAAKPTLAGTKRKAPTTASDFRDWSCALCQVSTTSQQGLNDHLQGKKHKAKEESLRAGKTTGRNQAALPLKKAIKPKIMKKGASTSSGINLVYVKKHEEKKPLAVDQPAGESLLKKHVGVFRKGKFTFVCDHCKIKCNSELMMVAHLGGKKHLARMQELEANGGAAPSKVATSKGLGKVTAGAAKEGKVEIKAESEVGKAVKEDQGGNKMAAVDKLGSLIGIEAGKPTDEGVQVEEQIDEEAEPMEEEVDHSCHAELKEEQE